MTPIACLVVGLWSAALAAGLAALLAISRSWWQRKRLPTRRETARVLLSGGVFGGAAGAVSQALFEFFVPVEPLGWVPRMTGWMVYGGLLGAALGRLVPGLSPRRAALGGLAGGVLGGSIVATRAVGESELASLLVGAAALGAAIGMMMTASDPPEPTAAAEGSARAEGRTLRLRVWTPRPARVERLRLVRDAPASVPAEPRSPSPDMP